MTTAEVSKLEDAIVLMRDLARYQNNVSKLLDVIRTKKELCISRTCQENRKAKDYFTFTELKDQSETLLANIDMVTADITNILSSLNYESIPAHDKEIIDAFTAMQFALKAKDKDNFCTFRQKWNELIKDNWALD